MVSNNSGYFNNYSPVGFGNLTGTSSSKLQNTSFQSNQTNNLSPLKKDTFTLTKKKLSDKQKYWLSISAVAGALLIAVLTLGKNTKAATKLASGANKSGSVPSIPYIRT